MELSLITQMQDQSQHFSNTTRANGFSLPKVQYPPKTFYAPHKMWSLFESLVGNKKIKYEKIKYIFFFLTSYIFTFPLTKLFISSSIFLKIIKCLKIHVISLVS